MTAVAAANVCMCVCVFPDCGRLTPQGLRLIGNIPGLRVLILQKLPMSLISGQGGDGGWIRALPTPLKVLIISGKLRRHIHTVGISTTLTELAVIRPHGTGLM